MCNDQRNICQYTSQSVQDRCHDHLILLFSVFSVFFLFWDISQHGSMKVMWKFQVLYGKKRETQYSSRNVRTYFVRRKKTPLKTSQGARPIAGSALLDAENIAVVPTGICRVWTVQLLAGTFILSFILCYLWKRIFLFINLKRNVFFSKVIPKPDWLLFKWNLVGYKINEKILQTIHLWATESAWCHNLALCHWTIVGQLVNIFQKVIGQCTLLLSTLETPSKMDQ